MTSPKTAKDFEDLYLAEAVKVKHMRKALERFADSGNFIQVDMDIPANWTSGDVYIQKLVDPDPWGSAIGMLAIPKSEAEKGLEL